MSDEPKRDGHDQVGGVIARACPEPSSEGAWNARSNPAGAGVEPDPHAARSLRSGPLAMTSYRAWAWVILWGVLVAVALAVRPLLPIDETRYLSVAWEMWRRNDWLVPYLNGTPYTDKPPLLFWGMLLGWRAFGVNQWWPRLLAPLFGLISVFLLLKLARRLSPATPDVADRTLPFLSGLLWVTYSTAVLFDTLLTACVLLALIGVVDAWRGRALRGWGACGAGIGLGLLAKGPVVLVHVLPAILLAPWWTADPKDPKPVMWRRWYLGAIAALAVGAALALAWALPAAGSEGSAYRNAILWEQTAGRITHAFAHQRPWWWYLPLLPVILLPWILWPRWWRALARVCRRPIDLPARFALAWVVPGFIILSLISGKQVHYLIPLLPGVALLAGIAYSSIEAKRQVLALSLVSPALLIVAHLAGRGAMERYDLRSVAQFLKREESSGRSIAYVGRYSGEFHFLGRLEHPFDQIAPTEVSGWRASHPSGLVIRFVRHPDDPVGATFSRPYRDGVIGIWEAN
jgi:4-amino-4-deoxy-L-arabinose transferase-like glycosyltransferase